MSVAAFGCPTEVSFAFFFSRDHKTSLLVLLFQHEIDRFQIFRRIPLVESLGKALTVVVPAGVGCSHSQSVWKAPVSDFLPHPRILYLVHYSGFGALGAFDFHIFQSSRVVTTNFSTFFKDPTTIRTHLTSRDL